MDQQLADPATEEHLKNVWVPKSYIMVVVMCNSNFRKKKLKKKKENNLTSTLWPHIWPLKKRPHFTAFEETVSLLLGRRWRFFRAAPQKLNPFFRLAQLCLFQVCCDISAFPIQSQLSPPPLLNARPPLYELIKTVIFPNRQTFISCKGHLFFLNSTFHSVEISWFFYHSDFT